MSDDRVVYREGEGVASLLMNRPEKRNALDGALVAALKDGLERAEASEDAGVVLLRGAGPDFCSGADLAVLRAIADAGVEENLEDAAHLGELFIAIRRHSRPVVAAVHGRALAGGCGLASACDVVVAAPDAEFGYPEVKLGFVPAMVMTILRRKVGEGRAFELVVRGHRIDAPEALRLGLVTRILDDDDFAGAATAYARELASSPASAVALTKRLLYGLDGASFEDGIGRGAEVNALARMTEACRDGVRRFLEGRDPDPDA